MRLAVQLPTDRVDRAAEFLCAGAVAEMARAAEDAGFDAVSVTDHPFPPARFLASGGHHSLDPFVALSFAAAATRRVRLLTHVLVLPGTDEALDALRAARRGEPLELAGRGFRAAGNVQLPRPAQAGGPPLLVGGNSRRAIRRAVELADGWLPFPSPAKTAGFVRTAAMGRSTTCARAWPTPARTRRASVARRRSRCASCRSASRSACATPAAPNACAPPGLRGGGGHVARAHPGRRDPRSLV